MWKHWQKTWRRRLKLALWPHHANRHHPYVVRLSSLILILVAVISAQGIYNLSSGGSVLGAHISLTAQQLLEATNVERAHQQLPSLQLNEKLTRAAKLKADDMLKNQYWAHVAPGGTTPWDWLEAADYRYDYAGENLAKNFSSAGGVTTAWMASPEHRANILSEHYNDVGFAIVEGELDGQPTTLVVALYGNEIGTMAPVATNGAALDQPLAPVTRLGVAVQSLSPAAVGSLLILMAVMVVALITHAYRRKLPKPLQRSWRRHHGAISAGGVFSLCILLLVLYSGGQI